MKHSSEHEPRDPNGPGAVMDAKHSYAERSEAKHSHAGHGADQSGSGQMPAVVTHASHGAPGPASAAGHEEHAGHGPANAGAHEDEAAH